MLTVNFIGFFPIIRKWNHGCPVNSRAAMRLTLLLCVLACGLSAVFLTATANAVQISSAALGLSASGDASGQEEEPGQSYFGRDEEGSRVFGTDDQSPAGFYRDPENGDHLFRTAPPPTEDDGNQQDTQNVWITPQVKPGQRPDWPNRPGGWVPKPGWR